MKALLTVVMALALTPFFANAEEAKTPADAAATTPAAAATEDAAADAKKEEAKK